MTETARAGVEVRHQDLRRLLMPLDMRVNLDVPAQMPLYYAGSSRPKLTTLRGLFPANDVIGVSADPEPLVRNTLQVATHKVGVIHTRIPHQPGATNAIIGVDILTNFPLINASGEVVFMHHGKVNTPFDVPKHFASMYEASAVAQQPPGYSVDAHSVLLHRNDELMLFEAPSRVEVQLTQSAAEKLAAEQGLSEYLLAFHRLYDGILDPKMVLKNIAAGIDLLPLVYMRAVESINGVCFRDPRFPEVLRYATYMVTVGIAPELLQLLGVPRDEIIPPGSFIDKITYRALKGNGGSAGIIL